jgi:hypothetical protein
MRILVSNYHISVNATLVGDLVAVGMEVVMPSGSFARGRISFFAPNDEHRGRARIVDWDEYLGMEPMLMLIPCVQMVDDLLRIWEQRGKRDVIVLLTANSDNQTMWRKVPTDFLLSHDLTYHREADVRYKALYFSRPTILRSRKSADELRRSFEERRVRLYINNLVKERESGLRPEFEAAIGLRRVWEERTGWRMPMYGFGNPDGWPSPIQTQDHLVDSMFTFVSKRRETWGQLINESMQLGTPCLFLRSLLNSTFTQYLINPDTAIIGDTVEELVDQALALSWERYQTLVNEAYSQSQMFCAEDVRRDKLRWLLDKAARELDR